MFLDSTHRQQLITASLLLGAWLVVVAVTHRTTGPAPVRMDLKDLVSSRASTMPSRRIAVVGTVQPNSRHYKGYSEWWFTLERNGSVVPVRYTGPMVSTFFDDGAQVLVIGTMRDGTFSAGSLAVRVWM